MQLAMKGPGFAFHDGSLGSLLASYQDGTLGCHSQTFQDGVLGSELNPTSDGVLGSLLASYQDGALGKVVRRRRFAGKRAMRGLGSAVDARKEAARAAQNFAARIGKTGHLTGLGMDMYSFKNEALMYGAGAFAIAGIVYLVAKRRK